MTSGASVSVVIACYTEDRWEQLSAALSSLAAQSTAVDEIIVVVDNNEPLLARVAVAWPDITVLGNTGVPGASGARNTGASHARSEFVAFLDDDAKATPEWLEMLVAPFAFPDVVGTGGAVEPLWESHEPSWFPAEFYWVVGASYRGMPERQTLVRNVWAENMAVRREEFIACGGFREGFGKLANQSRPEDTDLCLRLTEATDGGGWQYVPAAKVFHYVPLERSTARFFLGRCYAEGIGKAQLTRLHKTGSTLSSERYYLRRVLPRAVVRGLRSPFGTGGPARLMQSAMTVLAVGMAACGFAQGTRACLVDLWPALFAPRWPLAALSASPSTVQYEGSPPPCQGPSGSRIPPTEIHQTRPGGRR